MSYQAIELAFVSAETLKANIDMAGEVKHLLASSACNALIQLLRGTDGGDMECVKSVVLL